MADQVDPLAPTPGVTPPSLAGASVAAEAAASLTPASAVAAEPSPTPAAAEPAPVAEPHPSEVPTLLEKLIAPGKETTAEPAADAPKPDAAKDAAPVEPAKPDAAAKADASKEPAKDAEPTKAEPSALAPAIDHSALKLPEGFSANDERMGKFTGLLNDTAKPPVERAQDLLNLAGEVMNEWAQSHQKDALADQIRTFNKMRHDWQTKIQADPVFGGAGFDTASGVVARMRDMFISTADYGTPKYDSDMKEFVDFVRTTGAGDHPAFFRMMHNIGRLFDEPAAPPPNFTPPPDLGKKPKGGGLRSLYATNRS